jgi:pimeloyl-ACP methyl ester carboxylesterase
MLAALNGVIGDYLAATDNPLAISMSLRQDGLVVIPKPSDKLVVLLHGLCLNNLQWTRKRHNHGAALAADLGYTPAYLHYNSGLHVSANGRAFAGLMESLVEQWPLPLKELAIVGHSMGGLVARSACHYGALAGHGWTRLLRKLVFLGVCPRNRPDRIFPWLVEQKRSIMFHGQKLPSLLSG